MKIRGAVGDTESQTDGQADSRGLHIRRYFFYFLMN